MLVDDWNFTMIVILMISITEIRPVISDASMRVYSMSDWVTGTEWNCLMTLIRRLRNS